MAKRGNYRRRYRSDTNQADIVAYLRKAGAVVSIIGQPVDLAVCYQGITTLCEVKGKTGKLNPDQEDFREAWPARLPVLRTTNDAKELLWSLQRVSAYLGASNAFLKGSTNG